MTTRTRYQAEYLYPGAFFPEETTRTLPEPTLAAAIKAAPSDDEGYFVRDGWYAVKVTATTEKRYVAGDGDETWLGDRTQVVGKWIIGDRVHWSEIEDSERNRILISNIKRNSKDGYGVKTRCGNWQIASDYTAVLSIAEVTR